MGTPFLGEVKMTSFNFAPKSWALCNGQFLPINQNQALFSLLGTMYGGNGQTTFALPDLRGRTPMHVGAGFTQGQAGGQEAHTVTMSEMPQHVHLLQGSLTAGNAPGPGTPAANVLANSVNQIYAPPANMVAMNAASVTSVGGSQPHNNLQPYLVISFCIALQGVFPSQN
jgi:microcystin-dependent protein